MQDDPSHFTIGNLAKFIKTISIYPIRRDGGLVQREENEEEKETLPHQTSEEDRRNDFLCLSFWGRFVFRIQICLQALQGKHLAQFLKFHNA